MNLLIGQNNSGKSNVLSFLHRHLPQLIVATRQNTSWQLDPIDRHLGSSGPFRFALGELRSSEAHQRFFRGLVQKTQNNRHRIEGFLNSLFASPLLSPDGITLWFRYSSPTPGGPLPIDPEWVEQIRAAQIIRDPEWEELLRLIANSRGGAVTAQITDVLRHLSPSRHYGGGPPQTEIIPAIRKIGEAGTDATDFSGTGLINRLAQLQNPGVFEQAAKHQFQRITEFLRTVIDNPTATLEIPYARDTILVHMDGRTLPLSSLGTGIHEVVILAAAATVVEEKIVCIEEPELHLHPLLQRKLLRYLEARTNNQYFITTHSAHLLDMPGTAVFHIRHHQGASAVEVAESASAKSRICADLGYRASDLLQANCVIWVEGPSDRVYLNHWIASQNPDLIEGIHYSIMFYGGRLLSHLSADDPEVSEFISLRRLNRHIAILIDSDKTSPHGKLNATKLRIRSEFNQGPGFAWPSISSSRWGDIRKCACSGST